MPKEYNTQEETVIYTVNLDFKGEIGTGDVNLEIIVLCRWHLKPWNWLKSRT